jgi:cbb3-type cytochrome oxidase maturation protein
MTPEMALILIWSGFLTAACTVAIGIFLWGIRSDQFGDQERARSLALEAEIPEEEDPDERKGGRYG